MEQVTTTPEITVITVCYNAAAEIEATLASILDQTAIDRMEVIVIDGASTDGTIEKIDKFASQLTKFISEPDKGIYNAMNKGLALSTGKYVLFMNAGDRFFNSRVVAEVLDEVAALEHRPDVIYGATLFGHDNRYVGVLPSVKSLPRIMGACHQSIFVDGDMIRRARFDESYRISADFDLIHRLYTGGARFAEVKKYVAIYNDEGVSSTFKGRMKSVGEYRRVRGLSSMPLMCLTHILRSDASMVCRRTFGTLKRFLGLKSEVPVPKQLSDFRQL